MTHWYVTAVAVREYGGIVKVNDFDRAEAALLDLVDTIDADAPTKDEGHRLIYRVTTHVGERKYRLELTVSRSRREEGPYDQLVRVRDKGRGTTKGSGIKRKR